VREGRRVWLAPAYVLHQIAYRDTSRIVEILSAEYGRLSLFARGANGPKSSLRGILRPFQRLLISWSGKTETCQLVGAEIDGDITNLSSERLMSGFYLNELLMKLTERGDPHPDIFYSYAVCVQALCAGAPEQATLRRFEQRLLADLGYGLDLSITFDDARSLRDAKRVLRGAIDACLDGRPLRSREVMMALRSRIISGSEVIS